MKIFFLIDSLNGAAGTERIATDVANGLYRATCWDIKFIVLSDNVNSCFALEKEIEIISIHGSLKSFISTGIRLHRLLQKEVPDFLVNVATTMSRISIPAAWGTCTKVITWEHFNLFAGSKLGYLWRLCSARFSEKTVVLTHRDRNAYPTWVQSKVTTIYNFPTPVEGKCSDLSSHTAISVGRLTAQKGFDRLLEVWKFVHQHNKEWKLNIVGNGEDEIKLKQQAHSLGLSDCVTFLPATPHIADLYQQASLYIMTSRFEGLPLVLIEAKQQGLPCISFDCPNGPDEVIRQDIDGKVIPNGNIQAMAESILSLISDTDRIKLYGEAAHTDIKNRFSQEKIIQDWINLFKHLSN